MNNLADKVKYLADNYLKESIEIRRHLHLHPELSKQEFGTAEYISKILSSLEIPFTSGIAGTGILATIKGENPGKQCIALRADMDALPILEQNDVPYKSTIPGIMHACGHDVHMASLLGTARILQTLREHWSGTVKLIFQPSEETYPGGAIGMIKEGVLKNPEVENIFGQHVYPELEAGKIGMRSGNYMASTDEIFLTVKGKGGHAAIPQRLIDPVLISAHIILAMQQIVSRNADPLKPTVISFGKVIADGRTNIIPDEVQIEGIMRTFDENWREEVKIRITEIAKNIAKAMGGDCEVFIDKGYPAVYNDPELTGRARKYAEEYLGSENIVDLDMRMTAEDFSYFAKVIPACFYRLGISNKSKGLTSNLHTATFDVDESSLKTGIGLMAWLAISELNKV